MKFVDLSKITDQNSKLFKSQMEKGTNTYAALDHVCDLIEKNSDSELTALFVITDGEPRDDDNQVNG